MTDGGNVVDDDTILEVLESHNQVVVKTSEVAEEIALKQQQTGRRLQDLRDEGRVGGRKVGNGYVWWSPSRVKD